MTTSGTASGTRRSGPRACRACISTISGHTGNQLAADAGASLRELMDRMGHSTAQAAMVYLHGSDERQRVAY